MINPRTIATEVAYADIATQAGQVQKQQAVLKAKRSWKSGERVQQRKKRRTVVPRSMYERTSLDYK